MFLQENVSSVDLKKHSMTNPIQLGDKCPNFSLPNQAGEVIHISDYLGKQKLVLFFYPKDDTSGCTAEAIDFTALTADFEAAGSLRFKVGRALGCVAGLHPKEEPVTKR